jgi:hypothetical protein
VRFEVFTKIKIWFVVFGVMMLCGVIGGYQCLEEFITSGYSGDGGDKFLQNVSNCLEDYMAS